MKVKPAVFTTILLAAFACAFFTAATHGADASKGPDLPADLRKGLVLYYDFEKEPVGNKIPDKSDLHNDGKADAAKWVPQGHFNRGGAMKFGPSASFITARNTPSLNPQRLTLAWWVMFAGNGQAAGGIISKSDLLKKANSNTKEDAVYGFQARFSSHIYFSFSAKFQTNESSAFAAGRDSGIWRHYAVTYDGKTQRMYMDGSPTGTELHLGARLEKTSGDLIIGDSKLPFHTEFELDDVMMFNRALSPDEVHALYKFQGGASVTDAPRVNASTTDRFADPGSLKVKFREEKSAKLVPKGFKYNPPGSKTSSYPVIDADDPTDVIRGKPVCFDMKTDAEIHCSVDSEKPLTKLVYTGGPASLFVVEIHNEDGSLLTTAGPYGFKNAEQTIEVPLPNITRFEVALKKQAGGVLFIKSIGFEPATSALSKSSKTAPAATPTPTAKATPTPATTGTPSPADRIRQLKQQLDQGQINKDEYDRRVKEILDAI